MQQESAPKETEGNRIRELRAVLQMSWEELAEHLNISKSMLLQVVRGSKKLGDLTGYRLSEAEKKAGIYVQSGASSGSRVRDSADPYTAAPAPEKDEIFNFLAELAAVKAALSELNKRVDLLSESAKRLKEERGQS